MKKLLLIIMLCSITYAEIKDYTFMIGGSIGKGDSEEGHANAEVSVSYNFLKKYENILFGAIFAYGIKNIDEIECDTKEYLVKVDYLLDFPFLFSAGLGVGEYELNNHIKTRTITSISVTHYKDTDYLLNAYISLDYRLLDLGTNTSEEVIFIHSGLYF